MEIDEDFVGLAEDKSALRDDERFPRFIFKPVLKPLAQFVGGGFAFVRENAAPSALPDSIK